MAHHSRAEQVAHFNKTRDPQDAPEAFLDTPEGERWLEQSVFLLSHGHEVEHVNCEEFIDLLSDDDDYADACRRYMIDLHFRGHRNGHALMAAVRDEAERVARDFLAPQADRIESLMKGWAE